MATLSSCPVKEEEEEEEETEDEEDEEDERDEEEKKDESGDQKKQRSAWVPNVFFKVDREMYHYVGQEIVIEEGLDSYAGMIWPAALALCHYMDTHRQELNLVDKAVLEIGAGTGLVSIVASLLGAWVTATDLPVVLNNLRVNLSRNTRGRCRHTPQLAALSWGYDLERTYPTSVYHYDYVMAADVVYHHDFLDELLATMKHFCKPGTTLIWANKVRFETDLTFTKNFKKSFHTRLLAEDGEMKIFMATCREEEKEGDVGMEIQDLLTEEDEEEEEAKMDDDDDDVTEEPHMLETEREDKEEEQSKSDEKKKTEEIMVVKDNEKEKEEKNNSIAADSSAITLQQGRAPIWVPSTNTGFGKDVYHFVGHDISIYETIDSFGAVMWPAALALCSFLDNNRQRVNLQGKEVLELGAGLGLVTIVASLLGASVTATDLPNVLSNLRANVMRNTRGYCRHMPQVAALSWGYDLERTYPTSAYHYDYVMAADVVYHHDFLDELLATMKHFCRPGTTLIWANKVRFETDLTFTENFKNAFNTQLLAEDGEMKIFMATCRE
ncbi:Protein-lysine methyltransferase METTL21C [Collichthys lucidus]|uniref:Protein-lysine methyltransferase METTL21C n=1 Tax=Collichthys lucidus TaxID=240159 RepID=A0A4U5U7M8_COLLU|nr:Protein-lysine methyltransferase METTL21C [Collichthys lucidus]